MSDEPFTLRNAPPVPPTAQFENNPNRQRVLLAGMDCLAGQLDLFPTDGASCDDDSRAQQSDG